MHPSPVFVSLYRPEGGQRPSPGRFKKENKPGPPKDTPIGTKTAPKWHQHGTKMVPNAPKWYQNGTKIGTKMWSKIARSDAFQSIDKKQSKIKHRDALKSIHNKESKIARSDV